ncbi:outer membrane homotrimeric porin [Halodesulfovibrio spirochaetisodalis]|uniref:Porin domain-containing protein n=1 Tax=Halodesulfovibrio spirochaetisodalis TaxID=1560234 RepID=A0A1B7XBN3_9BACT|nr:outer membrane homotrimeric porin [Halodesulfovibrio spirochaetisodalis]OBQ50096.1 hypothetical protein SP90_10640 [Halodesulfovibrio spirochaetisodalis]
MKRFIVSALAACMMFGATTGAFAAEIKASGSMWVGYDYVNLDGSSDDTNNFIQRMDTQIDIIASENLSATTLFRIEQTWGQANNKVGAGSGGSLGADGVNVSTLRAYVDFLIPSTEMKVRAGIQGFGLPGAVTASPVLDNDVAAIAVSQSFDNIGVTAFFARPYDTEKSGSAKASTMDLFGGVVSAELGNVVVSPYFMFANVSNKVDVEGEIFKNNLYWVGTSVEANPMPNLALAFDGIYGKEHTKDGGYAVAGKAAYTTDMVVPALVGWYASGNDSDGEGRMRSIDDDDFSMTTLIGAGAMGPDSDNIFGSALGKWGIGLHLEEISFTEKLSHTVRVTYVRGTNDKSSSITSWGEDDSATEFDLSSVYSIYDNLNLLVDFAYAVTDFDAGSAKDVDNVFKAAALVEYNF